MKTRISPAAALKLRSGQTFWRCQTDRDGTVSISEMTLKGSKLTLTHRSMFPEDVPEKKRPVLYTTVKIGPKDPSQWTRGYYLSSIAPGSSIMSFRTRRAAERWKQEVEAGLHPDHMAEAMDHWDFCDRMDDYVDECYRYDTFDDYDGPDNDYDYGYHDPHSEVVAREPLYDEPADDDRFALEA